MATVLTSPTRLLPVHDGWFGASRNRHSATAATEQLWINGTRNVGSSRGIFTVQRTENIGTSQQFVGFFRVQVFIPFQPLISGHFTIPKKRSPAAELPGPSDPFMVYFYLRFPKNNDPNVSKYTIHGSYRIVIVPSCFFPWIRRSRVPGKKDSFNGEILSLRISEVICLYEPHTLKK